jgi:hypothetical protein
MKCTILPLLHQSHQSSLSEVENATTYQLKE